MATVTVTGEHLGREARLSWTDGAVEGPEPLAIAARGAARAQAHVAPPGLDRGPASLESDAHPETIAATLAVGFDSVARIDGLPEPEQLPPGVVA